MAEALGIIGGVVGIAGFAVQITETAIKVKKLTTEIKNAPGGLESLTDEIAMTADLIGNTCNPQNNMSVSNVFVTQTSQACQAILRELEAVSKSLEASLTKSRFRGSSKVTLEKTTISDMTERLERAKSSFC